MMKIKTVITQLDATVNYLSDLYQNLKEEAKASGEEFPEVKKTMVAKLRCTT